MLVAFRDVQYSVRAVGHRRQRLVKRPRAGTCRQPRRASRTQPFDAGKRAGIGRRLNEAGADLTNGPRVPASCCYVRTRLGHTSDMEHEMTKADLVERVADAIAPRVTKKDCGLAVDAFLAAVKDALARGDRIELRGFGTFKVRHRRARTGPEPQDRRTGRGSAPQCAGLPTVETTSAGEWTEATACPSRRNRWRRLASRSLPSRGHDAARRSPRRRDGIAAGEHGCLTPLRCVSQPTLWGHASRVPGRGWREAVPPLTPPTATAHEGRWTRRVGEDSRQGGGAC